MVTVAEAELPEVDKVLIIVSDSSEANRLDVKAKLEANLSIGTVDLFDARFATPSLEDLKAYNSVIVYSLSSFANWAAGGGVVQTGLSFETDSRGLSGRWTSEGYGVWVSNSFVGTLANVGLGAIYEPEHPILTGFESFSSGAGALYNAVSTLNPGATNIALYKDRSLPLLASNINTFNGCVAGLNYLAPSSTTLSGGWNATTDGALLMAKV